MAPLTILRITPWDRSLQGEGPAYSAIHKAANLTVPGHSMISSGTIPETPISHEWSQQLEWPLGIIPSGRTPGQQLHGSWPFHWFAWYNSCGTEKCPLALNGSCRQERPPEVILYGGRPYGGFVNRLLALLDTLLGDSDPLSVNLIESGLRFTCKGPIKLRETTPK